MRLSINFINKFRDLSPRANHTDWATSHVGLVSAFEDGGCHVVSVTNPYARNLGFLYRIRYFSFKVAPQLFSRGWVDPVSDLVLFRKSGSARNWTRSFGSVARNSDHTLTTKPQRRSTFFYITYINSVRTTQETQYISVLQPGTLTTRPQRRSTFFYITYINSVRTSQETLYISII
jgi:hypothetical protein